MIRVAAGLSRPAHGRALTVPAVNRIFHSFLVKF